ncbi:hypothetical protein [Alsobacter sp. R-9]
MSLAAETVTISLGDEVLHLRPTLRAATRLHRAHGSFDVVLRGIAEGNTTILVSVLREAGNAPAAAAWLSSLDRVPLASLVGTLQAPLLSVVLAMAGIEEGALSLADDEDDEPTEAPDFNAHFLRLYRIATGWLGWPPAQAWDSTPIEIVEAYKGRIELLNSIFGTGDQKPDSNLTPEDKLRAIFASIGTRKEAA